MKSLLRIFITMFVGVISAQTNVSGNQSGTWIAANAPYLVTGTVTVPSGQILTIEPGVEINFQGHYKMIVNGQLLVNGTDAQPVLFTASNHTTGWAGVRFDSNSSISQFYYTTFEYGIATGNYPDTHGGAILLKDSDAEFYHCTFRDNQAIGGGDDGMGGAVYGINTGSSSETLTKFIDCKFIDNHCVTEGGAVKLTNDGHTEFTNCEFVNNNASYGGGAIMFYSALDVTITNCLFYQNSSDNSGGGAIKTLNPTVSLFFTNCTFVDNAANGSGEGGAMALDYAEVTIINSIIYNNHQTYGDEINIGMNASAEITYSDLDMPDDATGNNNLDNVNPVFVDATNGDLHLQGSSPCIDAGTDVGLSFSGSAPDMGCYEFESVGINDYQIISMEVYPNPATSFFVIDGFDFINQVQVFNFTGQEVLRIDNPGNTAPIAIDTIPNGIYLVLVKGDNKQYAMAKLIKDF